MMFLILQYSINIDNLLYVNLDKYHITRVKISVLK